MTADVASSGVTLDFSGTRDRAAPQDNPLLPESTDLEEAHSAGLPRHIPGGFTGVAADLDRRSRDWTMMVRLLDQQRMLLETAEKERNRLYSALQAILPGAISTGRSVDEALEKTKNGDVSSNLSSLFSDNLRELDQLENISKALTANLLWTRSSWEQYARSVLGAQKMREELKI